MLDGIDDILSDLPDRSFNPTLAIGEDKNIFSTARKGWTKNSEARCDFQPHRAFQHRCVWFFSCWKRSPKGRTLAEIKSDNEEIQHFGEEVSNYLAEVLTTNDLSRGDWGLITSPRRRHKDRNFADLICKIIARRLNVPYYQDVVSCRNRQRVEAEFKLEYNPPNRNLIVFDDFVTSGSTFEAMDKVLRPHDHVLLYICGINNH
jgi:hypothetical protein